LLFIAAPLKGLGGGKSTRWILESFQWDLVAEAVGSRPPQNFVLWALAIPAGQVVLGVPQACLGPALLVASDAVLVPAAGPPQINLLSSTA